MLRIMQKGALVVVFSIILFSCKKDLAPVQLPAPPVNDLVETEPPLLTAVSMNINDIIFGFYSSVPVHYNQTTKTYPLLIFIPGAGQLGTTKDELSYLLNDGIAKLIAEKKFPPNFKVNNKNYSFIVLTPQFSRVPTNSQVKDFVEYAKKNYRVDLSKVYISGLSMGGMVSSDMGAAYPSEFAAIAPIAGVFYEGVSAKSEKIALGNLPVWVFHNEDDPQVSIQIPLFFISELKKYNPAFVPKLTIFKRFGHNAWDEALNPAYRENGLNVYEWMLQYSR